jgi:hypothetical protein
MKVGEEYFNLVFRDRFGVASMPPVRRFSEWDESEHPRDHGKFAPKGVHPDVHSALTSSKFTGHIVDAVGNAHHYREGEYQHPAPERRTRITPADHEGSSNLSQAVARIARKENEIHGYERMSLARPRDEAFLNPERVAVEDALRETLKSLGVESVPSYNRTMGTTSIWTQLGMHSILGNLGTGHRFFVNKPDQNGMIPVEHGTLSKRKVLISPDDSAEVVREKLLGIIKRKKTPE